MYEQDGRDGMEIRATPVTARERKGVQRGEFPAGGSKWFQWIRPCMREIGQVQVGVDV